MATKKQLNDYASMMEEYNYWNMKCKTSDHITLQLINKNYDFEFKFKLVKNALLLIRETSFKVDKVNCDSYKNLTSSEIKSENEN